MIKESELKKHKEYWLENIQNELYFKIKSYLQDEGINQQEFADKLGYSKGYVSQILNGNFNFSLGKYIELALETGHYPEIGFKEIPDLDTKSIFKVIQLSSRKEKKNRDNKIEFNNLIDLEAS